KGCPLKCIWCHNPESISPAPQLAWLEHKCIACGECVASCPNGVHAIGANGHVIRREKCSACGKCAEACPGGALKLYGKPCTVEDAVRIAAEDRSFFENSGGGVTLSGGEPLAQPGFCVALLAALKKENIHTAVDTCGFAPWSVMAAVLPFTDIFLFDVKHGDSAMHQKLTGRDNKPILDNLRRLSAHNARIEVRIPLVPGCNDAESDLREIGRALGGLKIEKAKLLPYHSLARSKYRSLGMADTMPEAGAPSDEKLTAGAKLLRTCGLHAVSGRD
ncbi:MAG: glycyl-radical enzyme activating protein, partial [Kiritimatiellia bacterium]